MISRGNNCQNYDKHEINWNMWHILINIKFIKYYNKYTFVKIIVLDIIDVSNR